MECSLVREKLSCYLDGALDEALMEALELHLDSCSGCRKEMSLLRALTFAAGEIEEVGMPAGLKESIRQAISAETAGVGVPCERFEVALSAYADGELDRSEAEKVREHLAACSACAGELAMLRSLAGTVTVLSEVEPPSELRERILAATTQRAAFRTFVARAVNVLAPHRVRLAAAGAMAVAAVIVMLAVRPAAPPKPVAVVSPRIEAVERESAAAGRPEVSVTAEPAAKVEASVRVARRTGERVASTAVERKPRVVRLASKPRAVKQRLAVAERSTKQQPVAPTVEERRVAQQETEQPKLGPSTAEVVAAASEAGATVSESVAKVRIEIASTESKQSDRFERIIGGVTVTRPMHKTGDGHARLNIFEKDF